MFSCENFLGARLTQDDARDALQLLVIDDQGWIHWIKCPCLFEVFHGFRVPSEGLERESSAEVGVGVLGVLLDDDVEISDSLLMLLYHLIGLGTLMDIPQI